MKDQIEMLTHERHPTDAQPRSSDTSQALPQQQEQKRSLLDSVAQDVDDPTPPGEKPFVQGFETALTWLAYVAIVAVALLMTWSVGTSILKYMTW